MTNDVKPCAECGGYIEDGIGEECVACQDKRIRVAKLFVYDCGKEEFEDRIGAVLAVLDMLGIKFDHEWLWNDDSRRGELEVSADIRPERDGSC